MRLRVEHIKQDKRTGRVDYRRVIPAPLRPFIGKSEIVRSLGVRLAPGAKSLPPAALALYTAIHEEAERALSMAGIRASGVAATLDGATVAFLVAADTHHQLAGDDAARADDGDADALFATTASDLAARTGTRSAWAGIPHRRADKRRDDLETHLALLRQAYGPGNAAFVADDALDLCAANALAVDDQSPDFRRLCMALLASRIAAAENALQRQRGFPVPTPPKPHAAAVVAPAPHTKSVTEAAAECALSEGHSKSTQLLYATASGYFTSLHGSVPIGAVTKAQAVAFKAALQVLPAKLTAKERAAPLAALIDRYADKSVPRLNPKTVNARLATLTRVWNWSADHGYAAGEKNPFDGLKVKGANKSPRTNNAPKAFALRDLQALFAQPVFTAGARPIRGRGEAAYWLPLLALCTGARREELAMLMVGDITRDPVSRRWLLTIGDPTHHPVKGARRTKTGAQRTFPLPMALVRLGFIDYVASVHQVGSAALFPAMTTAGSLGRLAHKWGEWWSAYVAEAGIVVSQPFHGFRHAWTTAARASNVPEDAREWIQGHAGRGGTNSLYGDRAALAHHIDALSYAGLDLSNLEKPGAEDRAAGYDWST